MEENGRNYLGLHIFGEYSKMKCIDSGYNALEKDSDYKHIPQMRDLMYEVTTPPIHIVNDDIIQSYSRASWFKNPGKQPVDPTNISDFLTAPLQYKNFSVVTKGICCNGNIDRVNELMPLVEQKAAEFNKNHDSSVVMWASKGYDTVLLQARVDLRKTANKLREREL